MSVTNILIEKVARDYCAAFSKKDLNKLKQMFAANICLRDWEVFVIGRDEVCSINRKFFNTVTKINVDPVNIFVNGIHVVGELIIAIDDKEIIRVVDILEFDQDLKIISIKAYKG